MIKFGTDGWRGIIGDDFTFSNVRIVSQAIADYLRRSSKKSGLRVVIGFDRRFLSEEFASEVSCVLAANKIKVVLSSSSIPTPTVSFHALYGSYDLGVMITASHNPAKFNGLKIKTADGGAADKNITDKVEKLIGKSKPRHIALANAVKGNLIKIKRLDTSYVNFLKNFVALNKIRKMKLRVLVDIMYGAGDGFIESALKTANIKIDYLHNEFNPSFGGIHPEPIDTNLGELIREVKREKYDLGIALDGDADRIAAVTKRGEFINAQVLLPMLAIHMIKNRRESNGIGKTVVGSNLIDEVAFSLNVPCYETPVGFKYISNLFKENLISIGGEEAGGIGFKGYIPERDGTASFLMLLEMMAYEGKSFDELLNKLWKDYGKWYYTRTSFSIKKAGKSFDSMRLPGTLMGKKVERVNRSDGIKLITKDSWLMFRKSGTEPIIRVYAQARSRKELAALINLGKKVINSH
ncbi:MAG: hypothetical protein B1H08_04935 [Candidatus Omnitrophica bacterium 4484_171]|nr:MAG: hypothetical protein B1H08_04935 [Candidatus Omnitrophica bacterium 4484_171]